MATFEIENQGTSTYLSYALDPKDERDELSFGMLANNRIEGIAPIVYSQLNNERFFKYDISSKISAKKFFSGTVTKKMVITFLSGIISAILTSEEYMVDSSLFVLDINYIFVDMVSYKPILICVPILNKQESTESVNSFIRRLIFSIRYDQTENCDYVTKIINYVNGSPNFSIYDFKKTLDEIDISSPVIAQAPAGQLSQSQSAYSQPAPKVLTPERGRQERMSVNPPVLTQQAAVNPGQAQKPGKPMPLFTGAQKPQKMQRPEKSAGKSAKKEKIKAEKSVPADLDQPKISLFYLLQHYNKENLELYKAQKNSGASASASKAPRTPKANGKPAGKGAQAGFAMPGREQSFAMPGQEPEFAPSKPTASEIPAAPQPANPRMQPVAPNPGVPLGGSQSSGPNVVSANFGDTTILVSPNANAGETTVLGPNVHNNATVNAFLVRKKNGSRTVIGKPEFRIGKERSSSDLFIDDNAAISRNHAVIIKQGTNFFIADNNSTNHTYVNGMMLAGGDRAQIKSGDKITLANEEFDFIVEI